MLVTCGLAVRAFAGGLLGPNPRLLPEISAITIDLNRAPLAELMILPGVGRGRAEAIILYRVRHGPFRCIEDLAAVDGFGPQTVAGLHAFVRI